MTVQDVITALFESSRVVTTDRVRKAERTAQRGNLRWSDVVAAMTPEQRQAVTDAL